MQSIRRVIEAVGQQVCLRMKWFRAIRYSPSSSKIGWNAIVLGNVQIGEQSTIQDHVVLDGTRMGNDAESIKIGARTRIECGAQIHSWGGEITIAP